MVMKASVINEISHCAPTDSGTLSFTIASKLQTRYQECELCSIKQEADMQCVRDRKFFNCKLRNCMKIRFHAIGLFGGYSPDKAFMIRVIEV